MASGRGREQKGRSRHQRTASAPLDPEMRTNKRSPSPLLRPSPVEPPALGDLPVKRIPGAPPKAINDARSKGFSRHASQESVKSAVIPSPRASPRSNLAEALPDSPNLSSYSHKFRSSENLATAELTEREDWERRDREKLRERLREKRMRRVDSEQSIVVTTGAAASGRESRAGSDSGGSFMKKKSFVLKDFEAQLDESARNAGSRPLSRNPSFYSNAELQQVTSGDGLFEDNFGETGVKVQGISETRLRSLENRVDGNANENVRLVKIMQSMVRSDEFAKLRGSLEATIKGLRDEIKRTSTSFSERLYSLEQGKGGGGISKETMDTALRDVAQDVQRSNGSVLAQKVMQLEESVANTLRDKFMIIEGHLKSKLEQALQENDHAFERVRKTVDTHMAWCSSSGRGMTEEAIREEIRNQLTAAFLQEKSSFSRSVGGIQRSLEMQIENNGLEMKRHHDRKVSDIREELVGMINGVRENLESSMFASLSDIRKQQEMRSASHHDQISEIVRMEMGACAAGNQSETRRLVEDEVRRVVGEQAQVSRSSLHVRRDSTGSMGSSGQVTGPSERTMQQLQEVVKTSFERAKGELQNLVGRQIDDLRAEFRSSIREEVSRAVRVNEDTVRNLVDTAVSTLREEYQSELEPLKLQISLSSAAPMYPQKLNVAPESARSPSPQAAKRTQHEVTKVGMQEGHSGDKTTNTSPVESDAQYSTSDSFGLVRSAGDLHLSDFKERSFDERVALKREYDVQLQSLREQGEKTSPETYRHMMRTMEASFERRERQIRKMYEMKVSAARAAAHDIFMSSSPGRASDGRGYRVGGLPTAYR